MPRNFLRKTVNADFVVVDSQFPQKKPFAFRNSEINEYFKKIENFSSFTMCPMKPDPEAGFDHIYGVSEKDFTDNRAGYLQYYPGNADRIFRISEKKNYNFKLAYSFFLAETYVLLQFYEKNKIPFVFVLYPGGLFGLHAKESDRMLKKIFQSQYFKAVIVTQQITRDYLVDNGICPESKIHFIYGGFVQFKKNEVRPRQYFGTDKNTLDVCIVAAKYSDKGVDKGYDLFIEVAKRISALTDNVMFHVVGGFDAHDIDVSGISSRIKFYGYRQPDFLAELYSGMDIFLSPNRPYKLFDGNFDGFPLGIDAGYCGVALFVADELNMNHNYTDGKEIVIISLGADSITEQVMKYYHDPESLRKLARQGMIKTRELFDIDYQINKRLEVFEKYTSLTRIEAE